MRNTSIIALSTCLVILSACTNTDNPQLAMCQAVSKQLVGDSITSWDNIEEADTAKIRSIDINFTQADSSTGQVNCGFPIKINGDVETAPSTLVLNGQKIATPDLLKAGLKASGDLLKGTAANTVAKSKELASDAKVLAADAADKASEGAANAKKLANEVADKARASSADAKVIAAELADKTKDGVSQIAGEVTDKAKQATEALQEKLDN